MAGATIRRQGSAFQMASAVGVSSTSASSTTEPMVILIWRIFFNLWITEYILYSAPSGPAFGCSKIAPGDFLSRSRE
jgi:hypothetical protein